MSKYIKSTLCFMLIIIVAGLSSCATTPVAITASNTPLNNKTISENLGKVEGESGLRFAILGIWMIGRPDIQAAIDDALAKKGGDALINIKCYEIVYYFVLGSLSKVTVEGEAVRLKNVVEESIDEKDKGK